MSVTAPTEGKQGPTYSFVYALGCEKNIPGETEAMYNLFMLSKAAPLNSCRNSTIPPCSVGEEKKKG